MRRPHMSTGAWIFASAIAASVIAPTAVYAAATSTVAIGNTGNSTTASVTASHQLLTTTIAAKNVVEATGSASGSCSELYSPPAGKGVVITSLTYETYGNAIGDNWAYLTRNPGTGCMNTYDVVDTDQVDQTEIHTFPIGLPLPQAWINSPSVGPIVTVYLTGYLIPASQLPAATPGQAQIPAHPRRGRP
jgi:hypothetical protein